MTFMNSPCVINRLSTIGNYEGNHDKPLKFLLQNAYDFCISEQDFNNMTINDYYIMSEIARILHDTNTIEYVVTDSVAAATNVSGRIEPLQSIAETATKGKRSSENIDKVGYFNNMLEVEFHGGAKYVYFVGPEFYDEFNAAPSKGTFLWDNLRGRKPGLVYPAGPKKTPGGVGGSKEPYAKVGGPKQSSEKQDPLLATKTKKLFQLSEIALEELTYFDPEGKKVGKTREKIKKVQAKRAQKKFEKLVSTPQDLTVDDADIKGHWKTSSKGKRYWVKPFKTSVEAVDKQQKGSSSKKQASLTKESRSQIIIQKKKTGIDFRTINRELLDKGHRLMTKSEKTVYNAENVHIEKRNVKINFDQIKTPKSDSTTKKDYKPSEYIESMMDNFSSLPLIDVVKEGEKYKIIDGFHRYEAAKNINKNVLHVNILKEMPPDDSPYWTMDPIEILDFQEVRDNIGTLSDFGTCPDRYGLIHDFYHKNDSNVEQLLKKHDVNVKEDTILFGPITRAGPFKYGNKTKHKDWNNIKENIDKLTHLPLFGSRTDDSHEERDDRLIGYLDGFIKDEGSKQIYSFGHTFKNIGELSDLRDPSKMAISLSMFDDAPEDSDRQHIVGFRHAAISLNNVETDRCSSVNGYGSCNFTPIPQMFQDFIKKPNRSSSQQTNGPRKIIKQKKDLNMPDNKNEIDAKISKFLLSIGIKEDATKDDEDITDDAAPIVTNNATKGFTNKDEFMMNCKEHMNSPAACAKAWTIYQGQGNKTLPPIDKTTGGHVKVPNTMTNNKDFEDKLEKLSTMVNSQNDMLKKYEDFFTAEQVKKEKEMKDFIKLPFSEESQKLVEELNFDTIQSLKPIMDKLIKEHPEIMPELHDASTIQDMNLTQILDLVGKSREDMNQANDLVKDIKDDATKRLNAMWSKKGE